MPRSRRARSEGEDRDRVVASAEQGLVVLVEEALLVVGDVGALAVPGHEHLGEHGGVIVLSASLLAGRSSPRLVRKWPSAY